MSAMRNLTPELEDAMQEDSAEPVTDEDMEARLAQRLEGSQQDHCGDEEPHEHSFTIMEDEVQQGPAEPSPAPPPQTHEDHFWVKMSFMMDKKNDDLKNVMMNGLTKVETALKEDIAAERRIKLESVIERVARLEVAPAGAQPQNPSAAPQDTWAPKDGLTTS